MKRTLTYSIRDVIPYINWIYFFHAWGFSPRYATVSRIHACQTLKKDWIKEFSVSEQARATEAIHLFMDAEKMLTLLDENYMTHARVGVFDAYSEGDDIIFIDTDSANKRVLRLPMLRQQNTTEPFLCLADFVHPYSDNGLDKAGIFAAVSDDEIEHLFECSTASDDYKHLLAQTLSDRLAEATAERMHEEVRKSIWGYAPDEHLSIDDMFIEKYSGIRPAVGYPSLPDQSINFELARFLDFEPVGIRLTENGAMKPHASVSGLLLSHPSAHYFSVGKIGEDQLKNYAKRRKIDINTMRKFLAANL